MSWGATAAIALLTGVAGGPRPSTWCIEWYRLRTHDGGDLGYFIVFVPLGLLAGLAIGAIVARIIPRFWAARGLSLATLLALCALIGLVAWMFGEVAPQLDGDKALLQVELKYPPGWQPDSEAKRPEARSCRLLRIDPGHRAGQSSTGNVLWKSRRQLDGHRVPCEVMLLSSREVRLVSLTVGKSWAEFNLRMAPQPSNKDKEWSEWIQEGFSWETGKAPVTGYSYRCRVQRIGEIRDREAAAARAFWEQRDQAAAAIPADVPMAQWLPLFEDPDDTPAAHRWAGPLVGSAYDIGAVTNGVAGCIAEAHNST